MAVNTTTTSPTLDNVKGAAGGRDRERARLFLSEVRNELKRVAAELERGLRDAILRDSRVGVLRRVSVGARRRMDAAAPWIFRRFLVLHDGCRNEELVVNFHTYSGFAKKVAESLTERVKASGLQTDIGEVWMSRPKTSSRCAPAEGRDVEALFPRLHPGRDEHVRTTRGTW